MYREMFQITDNSFDDNSGEVAITDGGVSHRYVEIRLNSPIGKKLDYTVMAYMGQVTPHVNDRAWNVMNNKES